MKTSLVLEGGASRTLFTAGVLDVLADNNIDVQYIIGASAGISSGISYATGQRGRNYEVYTTYMPDKRYMGLKYLFDKNNKSYYNLKFVFEEIPQKLVKFDYEGLNDYNGEVIAVVTNFQTGEAQYLPVNGNDKNLEILKATCALPILFPPIDINGTLYMDGGISDSIPFMHAIENGCDKNIVILTRPRDYRKAKTSAIKLFKLKYKNNPDFYKAIEHRYLNYNNSLEKLAQLEKEGKVYVIAPRKSLGKKRTESGRESLIEMYNEGVKVAQKEMENLKEYLKKQ